MEQTKNEILKVEESKTGWEIAGQVTDWETLFMDRDNFLPVMKFCEDKAKGLVADPLTKDGAIAIKSLAKRIGQVQKAIEEKGMDVARSLKEKPKKIDFCRKSVKDALVSYKDLVLAPLKEIEARESAIVEIDNLPATAIGCDAQGVAMVIETLDKMAKTPEDWKESSEKATASIAEARRQLNSMMAECEKREAEQRELAELREKKAEMERVAREAAEAELAKAKAETARIAREKEESDRKAAEAENARKEAENAKAAAEKRAEEAAKVDLGERDSAETKASMLFPSDGTEFRRLCNREAMEDIAKTLHIDKEDAKTLVIAIAHGSVRHVRILY